MESKATTVDKVGNIVVDIGSLTNSSSGNPKMKDRVVWTKGAVKEQDTNETTKKFIFKVVCSQTEQLKQPSVPTKGLLVVPKSSGTPISDAGKFRKLNRLMNLNPRRIFLLFASLSSMGTVVLIYLTLAINWGQSFG